MLAAVALLLSTVSGCTVWKQRIEPGTAIGVTLINTEIRAAPTSKDDDRSIGSSMIEGMKAGVEATDMLCMPNSLLTLICLPVFVTTGAVVGIVQGSTTEQLEDNVQVPKVKLLKNVQALRTKLGEIVSADVPLAATLRDALVVELNKRWSVVTTGGEPIIPLLVGPVYLDYMGNRELVLNLETRITVKYSKLRGESPKIVERYESPAHHIDDWLADDGALLHREVEQAIAHITHNTYQLLAGESEHPHGWFQ